MAFSFNGTSSRTEATSSPITGAPFTMSCWFNAANTSAGGTLISIGNSAGTNRFQLVVRGDLTDYIQLTAVGSSTVSVNSTTTYLANRWYHATAVCSSPTSQSIYLNGAGKASSVSSTPVGINNIMTGARWQNGSRGFFFNGRIAEAAIWNAALTDDEILSLSKGFAPSLIRPMNLKFYNRCLRTSLDLSGGRTLTQVNITNFDHPRIYG